MKPELKRLWCLCDCFHFFSQCLLHVLIEIIQNILLYTFVQTSIKLMFAFWSNYLRFVFPIKSFTSLGFVSVCITNVPIILSFVFSIMKSFTVIRFVLPNIPSTCVYRSLKRVSLYWVLLMCYLSNHLSNMCSI